MLPVVWLPGIFFLLILICWHFSLLQEDSWQFGLGCLDFLQFIAHKYLTGIKICNFRTNSWIGTTTIFDCFLYQHVGLLGPTSENWIILVSVGWYGRFKARLGGFAQRSLSTWIFEVFHLPQTCLMKSLLQLALGKASKQAGDSHNYLHHKDVTLVQFPRLKSQIVYAITD